MSSCHNHHVDGGNAQIPPKWDRGALFIESKYHPHSPVLIRLGSICQLIVHPIPVSSIQEARKDKCPQHFITRVTNSLIPCLLIPIFISLRLPELVTPWHVWCTLSRCWSRCSASPSSRNSPIFKNAGCNPAPSGILILGNDPASHKLLMRILKSPLGHPVGGLATKETSHWQP